MRVVAYQTLTNLQGRVPVMPVEYEAAVKSLSECLSIDEAKHWSDKADALAAWAKIYRSDEAGRKARQLRLHAYRRMGELAAQIRPIHGHLKVGRGRAPGAAMLLRESGLTEHQAAAARQLARCSPGKFDELLDRSLPPSPTSNLYNNTHRAPEWASALQRMQALRATTRLQNPGELALCLKDTEFSFALEITRDLIEWLDSFEQHIVKRLPEQGT